jgi:hypothetical protein
MVEREAAWGSAVVTHVRPPSLEEVALLQDRMLISMIQPAQNPKLVEVRRTHVTDRMRISSGEACSTLMLLPCGLKVSTKIDDHLGPTSLSPHLTGDPGPARDGVRTRQAPAR